MTALQEIYDTLRELNLCGSQSEFSIDWLGRSGGYFAYLKTTGSPPDLSAIGMLIGRLEAILKGSEDGECSPHRRRIKSAIIAAKTMYRGEWELKHVPEWARCTAV